MEIRRVASTVYEVDSRVFAVGAGFALEFCSLHGRPPFEIDDDTLTIDANETTAALLDPFDFSSTAGDRVGTDIEVPLVIEDGAIEFVVGYYDEFPIYSPYHAITEDGDVYEIHAELGSVEDAGIEGDELLDISDRKGSFTTVRNVGTGWAGPVSADRLHDWFETGRLQAAIPVES